MQPLKLGLTFPLLKMPSMHFVVMTVLKVVSSDGFKRKDHLSHSF